MNIICKRNESQIENPLLFGVLGVILMVADWNDKNMKWWIKSGQYRMIYILQCTKRLQVMLV